MKNGFYEVGGNKFVSKFDAIHFAQQVNSHVTWNFHDDAFSKLDWSVEPHQNLKYFYTKRAQELRNKYDYLILHYSGGNDSNQILQSFIDAGVVIDEIVIRILERDRPNDLNDLSAPNTFGGYPIAYDNAMHVKNTHWPKLKISEYKLNDIAVQNGLNKDWIKSSVSSLDLWSSSWRDYDIHTGSYRLSDQGKKVAHILGIDKPRLYVGIDGWYIRFLDKLAGRHITTRSQTDNGLNIEFFFWSDTCGSMLIKQAHVLLDAVDKNQISQQEIQGDTRPNQDAVARILYSNKMKLWSDEKPMGNVITDFNLFYYKHHDTNQFKNWNNTLQELSSSIEKIYIHGNIVNDLIGIWSKSYLIKSFDKKL